LIPDPYRLGIGMQILAKRQTILFWGGILGVALFLNGCGLMMKAATRRMADNLTLAIADNDDPATVAAGAPAYLLMMDALIAGDPKNPDLLGKAAVLYTGYAGAFVEDPHRAKIMTQKAFSYGLEAVCGLHQSACGLKEMPFKAFEAVVQGMEKRDLGEWYSLGTAWAGWLQAHSDEVAALADISKVAAIMERILALDESYEEGGAHMYMGVVDTLLPAAMGGNPEAGRNHFERAMALAGKKNFMIPLLFAERYARLVFDRPLHDQLLEGVLKADPHVPGYTLVNIRAQARAKKLIETADDYF
jgi:hypothetical protein